MILAFQYEKGFKMVYLVQSNEFVSAETENNNSTNGGIDVKVFVEFAVTSLRVVKWEDVGSHHVPTSIFWVDREAMRLFS